MCFPPGEPLNIAGPDHKIAGAATGHIVLTRPDGKALWSKQYIPLASKTASRIHLGNGIGRLGTEPSAASAESLAVSGEVGAVEEARHQGSDSELQPALEFFHIDIVKIEIRQRVKTEDFILVLILSHVRLLSCY
jgi:hypothetical protein